MIPLMNNVITPVKQLRYKCIAEVRVVTPTF